MAPISDIRGRGSAPALLPGPARRLAVILICCCAAVVAAGAVLGAGRSRPNALSRPVDSWIRDHIGAHHTALQLISDLGVLGSGLVAIALLLAAVVSRRRNVAALVLISVPFAWILTDFVLKPLVSERIGNFLTYPSGHTQVVLCVATVLAVALCRPPRARLSTWLRVAMPAIMVAVGLAVAISLIGLDYHYFTDTVGGAGIGVGVGLSTALCLDTPRARRALRDPRQGPAQAAGAAPPAAQTGTRSRRSDASGGSSFRNCSRRPARSARW